MTPLQKRSPHQVEQEIEGGRLRRRPPISRCTPSPTTLGEALRRAKSRLMKVSSTSSLDAQVLLAHITRHRRTWVLAHPEEPLAPPLAKAFETALTRLEQGEPLPYLLAEWEFYGLKFKVTPEVLIPRPETELLVETALDWLRTHPDHHRAADIGTGCGCIAVCLAAHHPHLHLTATDISPAALEIARQNAHRHRVARRITFIQADLLTPLQHPPFPPHHFSLILANLPYIPSQVLPSLDVARREPLLALDGGPQGLHLIRRLLQQAPTHLAPEGLLLLEIDTSHAEAARALAQQAFPQARIVLHQDLAGHERMLSIQLS